MKNKIVITSLAVIIFSMPSCARIQRWQEIHSPPDDTCAHCHYTIYKNWKIAYRPYNEAAKSDDYEHVHGKPMSAIDVRMRRAHKTGKGECSECHITGRAEEQLSISSIGSTLEDTIHQLCGRCHPATFEEWRTSEYFTQDISCIVCHTDTRDGPLKGRGKGYYHVVEGIEGFDPKTLRPSLMMERLKKAVEVNMKTAVTEGTIGAVLTIINKGVGHNLPTDAINASLIVKLTLLDIKGKMLEAKETVIGGGGDSPIPPGEGRELRYEFTRPLGEEFFIRLALSHYDREREERPVPIYSREFNVNGNL